MPKNPEKRSKLSIPIPNTIRDAFLRPEKDDSHMSHTIKVGEAKEAGEKPVLTADNHAVYIGKFIPFTFGERVGRLMGWGDINGRLYTQEFLEGCLDYQFRHLAEGEKAVIVIGRSLSELFNGPNDTVNALSLEDEKELIRKIARKKFKKGEDDLDIVEFEEILDHQLLYKVLREHVDKETGVVDFPKAMEAVGKAMDEITEEHEDRKGLFLHLKLDPGYLEETRIIPEPRSLIFAKQLYDAYENDDRFRGAIDGTVPKHLKYSGNASAAYYGLTEIAMRLADIKNGRVIHGGVDRQEKYDMIIKKIVKGKEGGFKRIEDLEPLFEAMEGQGFETLHLKTSENPHEIKKIRTLAQSRIAIFVALSAAVIIGAYEFGKYNEAQKQEKREELVDRDLKKELDNVDFYFGGGPFMKMSKDATIEAYKSMADTILEDIKVRYMSYMLTDSQLEELRPFLYEFLIKNKRRLVTIHGGNRYLRIELADRFVAENEIYFRSKGIEPQRPYQELYDNYWDDFLELLDSDEDVVVNDYKERSKEAGSMTAGLSRFRYIGTFSSAQSVNNEYQFYIVTLKDGSRHIVAKDEEKIGSKSRAIGMASYDEEIEYNEYTTKRAKEGIRQFVYAMKRYDLLSLTPYEVELRHALTVNDIRDKHKGKMICDNKKGEGEYIEAMGYDVMTYNDSLGKFSYEFVVDYDFDEASFASVPCILARRSGEKDFTSERTVEMAQEYCNVDEAWYSFSSGEYYEARLPLDISAIEMEIEEKMCRLSEIEEILLEDNAEVKGVEEEIQHVKNLKIALERDIEKHDENKYNSYRNTIDTWDQFRGNWDKLAKVLLEEAGIQIEKADELTE